MCQYCAYSLDPQPAGFFEILGFSALVNPETPPLASQWNSQLRILRRITHPDARGFPTLPYTTEDIERIDNYIRPGNKDESAAPLCETRWEDLVTTQLRPTGSYTRFWFPENFRAPSTVVGRPQVVTVFAHPGTPGNKEDSIGLDDGVDDWEPATPFKDRQSRPYSFRPAGTSTSRGNKRKERHDDDDEESQKRHRPNTTPQPNATPRSSTPRFNPTPPPTPKSNSTPRAAKQPRANNPPPRSNEPPPRLRPGRFVPGAAYAIWVGYPSEQDDRPVEDRQVVYGSVLPNGQVQFKVRGHNENRRTIKRKDQRRGVCDIPIWEITWISPFTGKSAREQTEMIGRHTLRVKKGRMDN